MIRVAGVKHQISARRGKRVRRWPAAARQYGGYLEALPRTYRLSSTKLYRRDHAGALK